MTYRNKKANIIVYYRIKRATTAQFVLRVWSVAMLMLCSGDVIYVTVEVASLFSELASQEFISSSKWEFWSSSRVKHSLKGENCTEAGNRWTWCTENFLKNLYNAIKEWVFVSTTVGNANVHLGKGTSRSCHCWRLSVTSSRTEMDTFNFIFDDWHPFFPPCHISAMNNCGKPQSVKCCLRATEGNKSACDAAIFY